MAIVEGEVRTARGAVRGVLVEVFAVPHDFRHCLPLTDREQLDERSIRRLGSTLTDDGGRFRIDYGHAAPRRYWWFLTHHCVNLWLVASAYSPDKTLDMVYQDAAVRHRAGSTETYAILLNDEAILSDGAPDSPATPVTPDDVTQSAEAESALAEQLFILSKDALEKRSVVRNDFRTTVAPMLRKELSSVPTNDDGNVADPDFVSADESVRHKAEARLTSAVKASFSTAASNPMRLSGRLLLTDAQRQAVLAADDASTDSPTVTLTEDALEVILKSGDGEGINPENGQASVTRTEAVQAFCREKIKGELCLLGGSDTDDGDDNDGDIDVDPIEDEGDVPVEPVPLSQPQAGDRQNRTGDGVALEALKDDLPLYIAEVLNEASVLDPRSGGLPSPGDQLQEDDVAKRTTFPSLSLPPGPADVPAFHDFHDLQIAFKPVWMEALDDTIFEDAESAYEHYVELGGDPDAVKNATDWESLIGQFNFVLSVAQDKPPASVTSRFDITAEEWNVLPKGHRYRLEVLALSVLKDQRILRQDRIGSHDYRDGVSSGDLEEFERTHKYVDMKVARHMAEARRIVRFARSELEHRAGSKSPVPSHRIISALKSRALSQYPATYFAANRKERSVNFGLLITYRQRWDPTVYQVGELIKSIPLAPKEVRKYSKKIVMKEKRARKEVESHVESLKSETSSTSRAEAEIVQKAMDKTNFNATASGSFKVGIYDISGSNALTQDAEKNSAETKKSFHEAVIKAAREYKNELKVEMETESSFESEFQESGEIMNPNDELAVTYLFYELQRRYRVTERLHRLTSVVLVAQEVPQPADIDEDWLIAHRWILKRVLLDDSFQQPLRYVAEGMVAEEHALHEMRKSLAQQRNLVDELKEDVAESRSLTESRYASLQRSMERSARATQNDQSGGLFGLAKNLNSLSAVYSFTDRLFGSDDEDPEAARIREAATRDAYERELQRLRDLEGRLAAGNNSLARATEEYTDRISAHLTNVVRVEELKNHMKTHMSHYMQAIWLHEPEDQRWLRLKDVPVPVFTRRPRNLVIGKNALAGSLANIPHLKTHSYGFSTTAEVEPPNGSESEGGLETVPLYQVADLGTLLGFKANYMIFALKRPNALTDFMMEPFVERAAGGFGISDPDDLGNMTLDEFSDYVCCLKEQLTEEEFGELRDELLQQLKKLLQSPLRDNEEVVIPLDAMYIEALPSSKPILENFKLLHRQIDAADAQEDLRLKKMEKLRYAQRLLHDKLDDPETEGKYVFEGATSASIAAPNPGSGGPSSNA